MLFYYSRMNVCMNEKEELLKVGKYNPKFNEVLGIKIEELEIYRSKGLPSHMVKRKHFKCLKYIDYIPDIILEPDYIGINPNEQDTSIELVKKYADNVMIGIKLDTDGKYLYVSTMHDIQESKISRRLYSGRLKEFSSEIQKDTLNDTEKSIDNTEKQ